jgi:hypothetical protein
VSILRQSPAVAKTAATIPLSTLAEVIPPAAVSEAIERAHARGYRRRKFQAELMAVALVVLGLFAGATVVYAVRKTLHGLRLRSAFTTEEAAGGSAICQARYRYGPRRLRELFGVVCQPLAAPETPGAFLFGLRLLALFVFPLIEREARRVVHQGGQRRGEAAKPRMFDTVDT